MSKSFTNPEEFDFELSKKNMHMCSQMCTDLRLMRIEDMRFLLYYLTEKMECRTRWSRELPYIKWPADWEVQFIPSYDTLLRGRIRLNDKWAAFYFDGYAIAGCYGSPYWETYCPIRSECWRYDMDDVKGLLEGFAEILSYIPEEKPKEEDERSSPND